MKLIIIAFCILSSYTGEGASEGADTAIKIGKPKSTITCEEAFGAFSIWDF